MKPQPFALAIVLQTSEHAGHGDAVADDVTVAVTDGDELAVADTDGDELDVADTEAETLADPLVDSASVWLAEAGTNDALALGEGTTMGGARDGEGTPSVAREGGIVASAQAESAAKVLANTDDENVEFE